MKRFVLKSDDIISNACNFIAALPLDPLQEVIIRDYEVNRSLAQNALYWTWITAIGNELGYTKDEMHEQCKRDFLIRIYERDKKEYAKILETVREVYRTGMKNQAKYLFEQVVRLTSTRDASIKQFTEYLNDIEKDAFNKGITLPHPEDRYYEAMGISQ